MDAFIDNSSTIILLPGSLTSIYELAFVIFKSVDHNKRIILVNTDGGFDKILTQLDALKSKQYLNTAYQKYLASNLFNISDILEVSKFINE
jgi:2-succinyl-5-enolpyruvyl-6-hydroxy-3-cyclohexene-1-carboxylate synthase